MELHGLYNKYMYYPSDFNLRFISLNYKDIDSVLIQSTEIVNLHFQTRRKKCLIKRSIHVLYFVFR